jgi:hypothetical protein
MGLFSVMSLVLQHSLLEHHCVGLLHLLFEILEKKLAYEK